MKTLIITFSVLFSTLSQAGTAMKIEGSCSGTLKDNSAVSFTYYSSFDGCSDKSSAAVSFSAGQGNALYTGDRGFSSGKDIYSFKVENKEAVRLTFADSTGNTSGTLRYTDEEGKKQSVELACEVRDYEYAECEG